MGFFAVLEAAFGYAFRGREFALISGEFISINAYYAPVNYANGGYVTNLLIRFLSKFFCFFSFKKRSEVWGGTPRF
jgi:hypothetical protein